MTQQLFGSQSRNVELDQKLGEGGEGVVYGVVGSVDVLAKIYRSKPAPEKQLKLVAMVEAATPALRSCCAWPIETLHSKAGGDVNDVVGLLIPRAVDHQDIHKLYGPADRKRYFSAFTSAHLVDVATNIARVFETVHSAGLVIGDVNEGGVGVAATGTVFLYDCDSFQFAVRGQTFTCDAAKPEFTAPELHRLGSLRNLERTANHDAFGLAVLIFQVLFFGRHPFSGVPISGRARPLTESICAHAFAWARDAHARGIQPPSHALELDDVGGDVAALFERAFLEAGVHARPTPTEWIGALQGLRRSLVPCANNGAHWHVSSAHTCPICQIEDSAQKPLFLRLPLPRWWPALNPAPTRQAANAAPPTVGASTSSTSSTTAPAAVQKTTTKPSTATSGGGWLAWPAALAGLAVVLLLLWLLNTHTTQPVDATLKQAMPTGTTSDVLAPIEPASPHAEAEACRATVVADVGFCPHAAPCAGTKAQTLKAGARVRITSEHAGWYAVVDADNDSAFSWSAYFALDAACSHRLDTGESGGLRFYTAQRRAQVFAHPRLTGRSYVIDNAGSGRRPLVGNRTANRAVIEVVEPSGRRGFVRAREVSELAIQVD